MKGFELYIFFLCLFVFVALAGMFTFLITYIAKQRICITSNGLADEKIKENISKKLNKKAKKCSKVCDVISRVMSISVCAVLCLLFAVTGISSCMGDGVVKKLPAIKVISSTSMSEKYEKNAYLFTNGLNDQLQLFDVVLLHELPPEDELELYDIVVYEHISGALLVHRIVAIEEPNEKHPNERHFLLQGDAVHYPDTFPVRYSQMKSIYRGERIPNVGSFVYFMQSPAGIICLILIVLTIITMPIADNYISKVEYERVRVLVGKGELDQKALELYKQNKKSKSNTKGGDEVAKD